ncbi:MAG: glutathione S-transferase family protein [Alphaproteobacteria bacterium]|nr:glutathione S-transferase family protein [Alphaproteobacteria bacterium]
MAEFTLVIGDRNISSWSLRPWLVLKHLGVAFDEVRVRLRQPDTRRQNLRHSPSGKVPVLKHNGLVIWDSLAIAEYLAEQFPARHLWPADAAARATARAISAEMHSGFQALRTHLPTDILGRFPGKGLDGEGVALDIARIQEIWQDARTRFGAGGPFLFGAFGIADAMYAPVISRFLTYNVTCPPECRDYMENVWNMPVLQEWRHGCSEFG